MPIFIYCLDRVSKRQYNNTVATHIKEEL